MQSREMLLSVLTVLSILTAIFAKDRLFCSVQPVLIFLVISVISNASLLCSHSAVRGQASVDAIRSPDEGRNAFGAENRTPQTDTKPLVQESKREPFFGELAASFKNRLFKTDDVSELELVRMQRLTGDTTYPLHVLSELEGWFPSHRLCTDKSRDAELIYLGAGAAFNRDSPDLSASAKTNIKRVGKLLAKVNFSGLLVIGHADNLGTSIYNYELSQKRAQAFYDELIKVTSLPPEKIRALGRGDTSPIFSPSTTLSIYNRRVELLLICERRK
jgi:flagellar motor protein MotB